MHYKYLKNILMRVKRNTGTYLKILTSMIITNENMTITMVNTTFESIMGIPKENIEGKMNWIEMISPLSSEEIEKIIIKLLDKKMLQLSHQKPTKSR